MTEKTQHPLLSSREVAQRFGVDVRTIQRKAESGDLEAQKLPGDKGAYVFDRSYIESLQDAS